MKEIKYIKPRKVQSYNYCIVANCKRKDLKLYSFPSRSDYDRTLAWVTACQNPRIKHVDDIITKHYKICERHFAESDFIPCTDKRLYKFAVPTLHLPAKVIEYAKPVLPQNVDLPIGKPDKSITDVELHLDVPFKDLPYLHSDNETKKEFVSSKAISDGLFSVLDTTPDKFVQPTTKSESKLNTDPEDDVDLSNFTALPTVNCRICLAHTTHAFSLIDKPKIAEMLESLITITISKTDYFPTMICLKCLLNLKLAYMIQQKMLKAEQNLQGMMKTESDLKQENADVIQTTDDSFLTKKPRKIPKKKKIISKKKPELCPLCNKKFLYIETHLKRHNEKSSLCEICGDSMPALRLSYHRVNKHKIRSYKCKFCSKIFPTKDKKEVHEARDHTKQPNHMCEICGKRFYIEKYLKLHVANVHHKKRPYICEICSASYRNVFLLNLHQRVHTKIKPFKCQICDKLFRQNQKLKRHLLRVHKIMEDLTWKCEECGKLCATEAALTAHQITHCEIGSDSLQ